MPDKEQQVKALSTLFSTVVVPQKETFIQSFLSNLETICEKVENTFKEMM